MPKFTSTGYEMVNGPLYVDGSNRVGIGTTTPDMSFQVSGTLPQFMGVETTGVDYNAGLQFKNDARVWLAYVNGGDADKFQLRDATAGMNRLTVDSLGRFGINNSAPLATLDVVGSANVSGVVTAGPIVNGARAFALDSAGNANFGGTVTGYNIRAKFQDIAEWVPSTEDLSPATVVVLNPNASNQVMPSSASYDTTVAGVVSAQPGLSLGEEGAGMEQIATTGRVKVRVDARSLPVRVGDLLVTGTIAGTAMRSVPLELQGVAMHRPGTIIGKALEPLPDGVGEILVLLSMQ